jgi:hypothetical protein
MFKKKVSSTLALIYLVVPTAFVVGFWLGVASNGGTAKDKAMIAQLESQLERAENTCRGCHKCVDQFMAGEKTKACAAHSRLKAEFEKFGA